jgi:hypothetical protein
MKPRVCDVCGKAAPLMAASATGTCWGGITDNVLQ